MFKRLVLPLLLASTGLAQAASLELTVTGLNRTEGHVLVAVYDQAELWLKGKPLRSARAKVEGTEITLQLDDLPEGAVLALSVVHDLNDNKRLDMNVIGMPTEPYGFSNNAAGNFGPPSFEAAKFVLSVSAKHQIKLN
ncbi:MAG: DUF2141 domain-containing protein [Inhella sp.]